MDTTYGRFRREDLTTGYVYEKNKPAIDISLERWRDLCLAQGMRDSAAAIANALEIVQRERARIKVTKSAIIKDTTKFPERKFNKPWIDPGLDEDPDRPLDENDGFDWLDSMGDQ